jgi:ubiquinone/menaquinone biosynthesis C-methylase UbiE
LSSSYDKLKEGMRWMWSLGDYTRLAEALEPHAEALADACSIRRGARVLDVAAGDGNFALAATRRGAIVTASDLTPHMVELGRNRAAAAGAQIEWLEADAEQLPFADDDYEIVASVFGAMFAPRPELVASEMFRVAKPGGLVAMANYGPGGFLGRVSDLFATFSARPALPLPSPFEWGDEDAVRGRLASHAASMEVRHRQLSFESESVDGLLEFWEQTNPPQNALKTMLPPEAYRKLTDGWRELVDGMNEGTAGRVKVRSPYILVLARKRGILRPGETALNT